MLALEDPKQAENPLIYVYLEVFDKGVRRRIPWIPETELQSARLGSMDLLLFLLKQLKLLPEIVDLLPPPTVSRLGLLTSTSLNLKMLNKAFKPLRISKKM